MLLHHGRLLYPAEKKGFHFINNQGFYIHLMPEELQCIKHLMQGIDCFFYKLDIYCLRACKTIIIFFIILIIVIKHQDKNLNISKLLNCDL